MIYGRLCVEKQGAGYVHFSQDLPPEFYTQITSEARVPQRVAGGEAYRWMKPPGARNEVLDCTVYAIFCTHMLLHLYTGKMWERLECIVQPPTGDLFHAKRNRSNSAPNPRAPGRAQRQCLCLPSSRCYRRQSHRTSRRSSAGPSNNLPVNLIQLDMVSNTNQNDIVLDILSRLQDALCEAKGELIPELVRRVEAGIRADWGGDRVFIAKRRGEGARWREVEVACPPL